MKRVLALFAVLLFAGAATGMAGSPKSYQVTGPVLELRDDAIVVEKGTEKWEIARDKDTKVTGALKTGSKVTIQYQMKATSVEVKPEGKKEK